MRGLRMSGAGSDRLTLESRPLFFYHRVVIDKAVGKVDYEAGLRLPIVGELRTAETAHALADFDHLRIFAYYDVQHSDGTYANSFRYGVAIEGPVDESKLDQLHAPAFGLLIAMPKTIEEANEIAQEVSRFLQMRVLVPERLRRSVGVR